MLRLFFFLTLISIVGCSDNSSLINPVKYDPEEIHFDVVKKNLKIKTDLPDHVQILVNKWFDEKVKINGFEGDMEFIVSDFNQKISLIENGKRVDANLKFQILLNRPSLSRTESIEGSISKYGTLTGAFSIEDFEVMTKNTQVNLIKDLSLYLKPKILEKF